MSEKADTGFKYISFLPRYFSFFNIKAVFFAAVLSWKIKNLWEQDWDILLMCFTETFQKEYQKQLYLNFAVSNFNSIKIAPSKFFNISSLHLFTKQNDLSKYILCWKESFVVHRKKSHQEYPVTASCICTW